jgi:hypothetical protein
VCSVVPGYHGPTRAASIQLDLYANPLELDTAALQTAIMALAGFLGVCSLVVLTLVLIWRGHEKIVNATFLFCVLITLGTGMAMASVVLTTLNPQTTWLCQTKFGLLSASFVLVYGGMMIKTARIHYM